jgi:hypothetical protein
VFPSMVVEWVSSNQNSKSNPFAAKNISYRKLTAD